MPVRGWSSNSIPFLRVGLGRRPILARTACRPCAVRRRGVGGKWQRVRAETLGTVPLFGARVPSVSHANDDEERNRPRCAARRQRPRGRAPRVARPHRALSAAGGPGSQQDVAGAPRARLVGARARGARRGDSERRVPLSPRVGRRSGAAVGRGEEGGREARHHPAGPAGDRPGDRLRPSAPTRRRGRRRDRTR